MKAQSIAMQYGECRCCLNIDYHKDIMKEHYHNNTREVYYDMFVECFNLFLSTEKQLSALICADCVIKLKDACNFRKLVDETEQKLLRTLVNTDENQTEFVRVPTCDEEVKVEEKIEIKDEDENVMDCDTHSDDDLPVNDFYVQREADFLSRFPSDKLKSLPTRATLRGHCPIFVKYLENFKGKKITAKYIKKIYENPYRTRRKTKDTTVYVTEKMANTINACTLLEHSNVTIFKTKMRSGYPCFYCREIFDDMNSLRTHQNKHSKQNLFKLLSKYTADSLVVYADVTNLKCTICNENITNLNDLKSHLTKIHDKRMYTEFEDRVIPFKLTGDSDFECQHCGFSFETFGAIERHMNVHYRNRICEQCGAGFVTMHRLKIHKYTVHKEGTFPCSICKKIYSSYNKYKIHFDVVHNMQKKNKCPKCPERFIDYFTRQKHLVEKHGVTPILYKCKVCDRGFTRRFILSEHMKRVHLDEKEIQCSCCPYMCCTKTELRVHMLKHGTEKMYKCLVCKKSYARQKTLKEHLRIHDNDMKFSCHVCGEGFLQNSSLRVHIKTHHQYVGL